MSSKKNNKKIRNELLIEDDSFSLHKSKGNGILRRQIWQDIDGNVTRYRLAYINFSLYSEDNGRVLGYDNAHGFHHRHHFGKIEKIYFTSFEDIEQKFQHEFEVIHETLKKK